MICAIILAGGSGKRFGGPKQLAMLGGVPVMEWSLRLFQDCAEVDSVIVVIEESNRSRVEEICRAYPKVGALVTGGETRTASSMAGLSALPTEASVVLIHDAARPLASPELVGRVMKGLDGVEGCIPALPLTDTVKMVDGDIVRETLSRDSLVIVQTPQAFDRVALVESYQRARSEGFEGTDDASILERYGRVVRCVSGEARNIKVTHRADIVRASSMERASLQ